MQTFRLLIGAVSAAALFFGAASAQVSTEAEARLRDLIEHGRFTVRNFPAEWLPDGSGYTRLEAGQTGGARELVHYDAETGARTVLVSREQLVPPGGSAPLRIEASVLSQDGRWLLLRANTHQPENVESSVAELWTFDRASRRLHRVAEGANPWSLTGTLSPDGRRLVYSRGSDLFVTTTDGATTVRLTTDGAPDSVSNLHIGWSSDSRRIAYLQVDERPVRLRAQLEPDDPTYPRVRRVRFARVGTPIPSRRVGVVSADGTSAQWLAIPSDPQGFYPAYVAWTPRPHEIVVEKQSRFRDAREFLLFDLDSATHRKIYEEQDSAWVDASSGVNRGLRWLDNGDAFVLLSERDGWRRAYLHSRTGEPLATLTPPAIDVIAAAGVRDGWFYYYASPENATQRYLYRVRTDGSGEPQRVTPAERGTHEYAISPDGRWAVHTQSTFDQPPVTQLVTLPDHRVVRVLEENAPVRARVDTLLSGTTEFVQLDIGGGVVMDAWVIRPRDFDPAGKYPLLVYVYGEPAMQTVLDRWEARQVLHQIIADQGYVVVSMDNRGTPAPKGAAWRRAQFGSLGPLAAEEQAAGVRELARLRSYVDLSRVGIWGGSGGGSNTLNALFRRSDVFHVGIAVAPKPQPHLYNAWFQEIYMRTPEVNPEGYRRSAPINFAEGLQGKLLVIHGTGETNTHIQITEGLVDRLIELGKSFDYMAYPNRNHQFAEGKGTRLHMRTLMLRYLLQHLPSGPRYSDPS